MPADKIVTVPVTHRLIDRSLEIPPYLQRNLDGSAAYPDVVTAKPPEPLVVQATRFIDWRQKHLTEHDRQVIKQLQEKAPVRQAKLSRAAEEAEEAIHAGASWDTIHMRWKYPPLPGINPTRLKQGEKQIEREGPRVTKGSINFFE